MKGQKTVAQNKKSRYNYTLEKKFEAGLSLLGSEVKSIRAGGVDIAEAYVVVIKGEAYLVGCRIAPYQGGAAYNNHEPDRRRKLLLNKKEIWEIQENIAQKGMSCYPMQMKFKGGRVKIDIGIGVGKKKYDKRQAIREKEDKKQMRHQLR